MPLHGRACFRRVALEGFGRIKMEDYRGINIRVLFKLTPIKKMSECLAKRRKFIEGLEPVEVNCPDCNRIFWVKIVSVE